MCWCSVLVVVVLVILLDGILRPLRPLTSSSSSNQGPIRMSDGLMMIVMAWHLCGGAWVGVVNVLKARTKHK